MTCREPTGHLLQIVVLQLGRSGLFGILLDLVVVTGNLLGHDILIGAEKTLGAQHAKRGRFKTSGIFEPRLDKSIALEIASRM
jgi:hypothetical protein